MCVCVCVGDRFTKTHLTSRKSEMTPEYWKSLVVDLAIATGTPPAELGLTPAEVAAATMFKEEVEMAGYEGSSDEMDEEADGQQESGCNDESDCNDEPEGMYAEVESGSSGDDCRAEERDAQHVADEDATLAAMRANEAI